MPFGRVFERWPGAGAIMVMGANQIDQFGNQNLSAFRPIQHPTRLMFGVRGAPGNTINHATSYFVGNHAKRVFCEPVDIVSRNRLGQGGSRQPVIRLPLRRRLPVVSNLGCLRLQRPGPHDARAVAAPGVEGRSGRREHLPSGGWLDTAGETRLPSTAELELL